MALENTLSSIEQAIALGCELIEVDLRRTADRRLILMHDARIDRTTEGRGLVAEMRLARLQRVRTRDGQRIPTLEEALDAVSGRAGLMLELKGRGTGALACDIVGDSQFTGRILYASFRRQELALIQKRSAKPETLLLVDRLSNDPLPAACALGVSGLGVRVDLLTTAHVTAAHRAGLHVFVYTVNEPGQIKAALALEVDGIISDFPDRIPRR